MHIVIERLRTVIRSKLIGFKELSTSREESRGLAPCQKNLVIYLSNCMATQSRGIYFDQIIKTFDLPKEKLFLPRLSGIRVCRVWIVEH